ncbi:M15 family metallopeptidase [Flavobacterium agricola]|uniref:D-alanyl-D-alanine dipeptidase n=1 Tax=Flavobacterium agricola TaxID=2870839 RepID=A0ABY6LZN0_9FLAO|nr:M15 family metallopeptidase [Flavobacterium agricola]UYW00915.1 M15 family metallopeptidase [Flavobacterium agricola]
MFKKLLFSTFLVAALACKKQDVTEVVPVTIITLDSLNTPSIDTISLPKFEPKPAPELDSIFVKLSDYSDAFEYDLRYATPNNFLAQQVYDCGQCYLRYKTVVALIAAQEDFNKLGYRLKLYDCYRPLDVQKKMWQILPGTNYVANPAKGSVHNRGGAVDLTLVDSLGVELDMGTDFDFFGPEAHHAFTDLDEKVLQNRTLLKQTMEKHHFKSIYSEWWHYNFLPARKDPVSNFTWSCS